MRTLLDAADSACVTRRKPSRPTQPYYSRSCSICLRRLGALRFSSHAVSDCRPIGRRSVYHSRRIALSSPNSSCAQENSAYGTSLFIRIYSVAFLTSAPAQMLFPLLPRTPRACNEGGAERLVQHMSHCSSVRLRCQLLADRLDFFYILIAAVKSHR